MTRAYTTARRTVAALRIAAQGIGEARHGDPRDVVGELLAVQAQDLPSALWGIGLRTRAATTADLSAALSDRTLVRSWPMRGTLHIVTAGDLGWMLGLTRERMLQTARGRHRQLGFDEAQFTAAAHIAEHAIGSHGTLARSSLLAEFTAAGISTEGQRASNLLRYLAVSGLTVFGPPEGKQPTFALLDEWVRKPRTLDDDEALAEFARRYLWSHGPATVQDFAWWSSLTLTRARRGIASVAAEFERLTVDDTEYLHRPGLEPAAPSVAALPGFDEYVLGYQDRSAQLAPEWFDRIVPGGNGIFLPTIVVDGEIVGTWKRNGGGGAENATLTPFAELSPAHLKGLDLALHRYGEFLERPVPGAAVP